MELLTTIVAVFAFSALPAGLLFFLGWCLDRYHGRGWTMKTLEKCKAGLETMGQSIGHVIVLCFCLAPAFIGYHFAGDFEEESSWLAVIVGLAVSFYFTLTILYHLGDDRFREANERKELISRLAKDLKNKPEKKLST